MPRPSGGSGSLEAAAYRQEPFRVLFICPEAPYPLHGGGAYRTASLFHYFARKGTVEWIGFRQKGDNAPETDLPPGLAICLGGIELVRNSKSIPMRLARNLRRAWRAVPPLNDRFGGYEPQLQSLLDGKSYDLAVLEHFWTVSYAPLVKQFAAQVVLDLHNVESALYASLATASPWCLRPLFRRFSRAAAQWEGRLLPGIDFVLVPSEEDAARIAGLVPAARTIIYPNAIPWKELPQCAKQHVIVFSGNLEYAPNQAAVRFFARHVWPELHRRNPDLCWEIIGRNPQAVAGVVDGLPGVRLTGPVEDTFTRIARAMVSVTPVLAGSGTRVKILESWAASTAVVSTGFGAAGLKAVPDIHYIRAGSPAEFRMAVELLLNSENERRRLELNGRRLYETEYHWEAAWKHLIITEL